MCKGYLSDKEKDISHTASTVEPNTEEDMRKSCGCDSELTLVFWDVTGA